MRVQEHDFEPGRDDADEDAGVRRLDRRAAHRDPLRGATPTSTTLARADGKPLPGYEPGSHVDLHLPNGLVRQYSLINPGQTESYALGIKRDPASREGACAVVHDESRRQDAKIRARNNFALKEDASTSSCWPAASASRRSGWRSGSPSLGRLAALLRLPLARRHRVSRIASSGWPRATTSTTSAKASSSTSPMWRRPRRTRIFIVALTPMLSAFEAATANWPREQVHVEHFTPKQEPDKKGGFVVELRAWARSS